MDSDRKHRLLPERLQTYSVAPSTVIKNKKISYRIKEDIVRIKNRWNSITTYSGLIKTVK